MFTKGKALVGSMLAAILVAGCSSTPAVETSSISVDSATYGAGDEISVSYNLVEEITDSAWMGIIPSDTPHGNESDGDAVDVDYQYLNGSVSGTTTFAAPLKGGDYDVRIYSGDDGSTGVELVSVSFTVEVEEDANANASVSVDKEEYQVGEEITVTFVAGDAFTDRGWVGLVPADIPHGDETENDLHDVDYEWLNGEETGTFTFTAPEAGEWSFRLHDTDNNGTEFASVEFTVVE